MPCIKSDSLRDHALCPGANRFSRSRLSRCFCVSKQWGAGMSRGDRSLMFPLTLKQGDLSRYRPEAGVANMQVGVDS